MMPRAVLFDLWNTLLYSPVKERVTDIIKTLGLGSIEYSTVMEKMDSTVFVNPDYTIEKFLAELCAQNSVECKNQNMKKAVDLWVSGLEDSRYFPETKTVLEDLRRDYKLCLVSNTDINGAKYAKKIGILNYFDEVVLSYVVGYAKPNKRIYEIALNRLNIRSKDAWMIGDSVTADVKGAQNAGLNAILLDRGGNTYKSDFPVVRDLTKIRKIIENSKS